MISIPLLSLDEIDQAAAKFLELAEARKIMAFSGEMGAGKTTFIQALCRQLGVKADVNSPTFALVNEYFTPEGASIFHFDLYRIEDQSELFDMGYEEYFYSGERCLIEWPERAEALLPESTLWIHIKVHDHGERELRFQL